MYISEVRLEAAAETEDDQWLIDNPTSLWRSSGQALGREFPIVQNGNVYRIVLMLPQSDALDERNDSKYVTQVKAQLIEAGFKGPDVSVLGEDPFSAEPCDCVHRNSFILYTTYTSLESCLRCGDCFGTVPLYVVPPGETGRGELHNQLMSWQSDYQSCDHLQMNCSTGEKFGLREISNHNSSLSKRGRGICDCITKATGIPTFYYLHRYRGRSKKNERDRKCPSCGGEWIVKEQIHEIFDFKCDHCRLLSNLALQYPLRDRPPSTEPETASAIHPKQ